MTEQQIIVTLATKVMGWEQKNLPNNDVGLPYYAEYWINGEGLKIKPVNFWNPLHSLADAFEVVDKLLSDFYIFELLGIEDGWFAIFKLVDGNFSYPKMFEGTEKTREKAICNAAMKVIEGGEKER
ncbi:BC1872 family protein [Brevibacillus laterosporus]|uniref:BC1872 family protein n=1 Tax=Brevibacillus laterosporus TaxID=1465 RepID=UPI000CE4C098|nr:hypothetical protein [Brevibacillus laterosporus]MED1664529.1 hypothetical protein [Brevibacillus laterosporus]MED1669983.1 hypothetical protein [Brevibacillus laterosporus]MED1717312.1 hypothetical protein [Brevibacillus laterosporus]PPA82359.1 hypothetical protein C4A76_21815 [Brevibacillus laterosporus]